MNKSLHALWLLPMFLQAQTQPATKTPIQHVVVIFQENVSFDHYFATYPNATNNTAGEPVFTPAPNTPSVNGLAGPLLTNNPNSAQPFRLTRAQEVVCDQNHNYGPEQMAVNSGLMNKFPESVGTGTGSELRQPLGISIVGGLIVSQMLTLFTTPVVYLYMDRLRSAFVRSKQRVHPLRPATELPVGDD